MIVEERLQRLQALQNKTIRGVEQHMDIVIQQIEHLIEVVKAQQKQINTLQQASNNLDSRTNHLPVVGGVFPKNGDV